MTKILLLSVLCVSCTVTVFAQQPDTTVKQAKPAEIRICTISRKSLINKPPLWVIHLRKHTYAAATDSMIKPFPINADWVEKINVYKDSADVARFGSNLKDGVVEVTLKDKNYAEAHQLMKQMVKEKKFREVK